tara:strand:+ start:4738 stop:5640 length:903 start_codon:yes stop_codon:yes gene_type:complete
MKVLNCIILTIIIVFSSCRKNHDTGSSSNLNPFENNSYGIFEFNDYQPLADKPFNIHFYIPSDVDRTNAPILFIFPGMNRNADDYLDTWIPLAEQHSIMVFSFEFSDYYYPNSTSYQLGYVRDFNNNFTNEDIWTFSLIEPVFDMIKNNLDYSGNQYNMFGHSAGAQFVHRYIQFKPNSRINKAVSANAGWYTLPDTSISFPYGLKGTSINSNNLENSFLKNLEVHLGQNDNNPNDPFLNTTDGANSQGNHRLSRGKYFILNSDSVAQNMNFNSNWIKKEVPNVGHQHVYMAAFAAQELF